MTNENANISSLNCLTLSVCLKIRLNRDIYTMVAVPVSKTNIAYPGLNRHGIKAFLNQCLNENKYV